MSPHLLVVFVFLVAERGQLIPASQPIPARPRDFVIVSVSEESDTETLTWVVHSFHPRARKCGLWTQCHCFVVKKKITLLVKTKRNLMCLNAMGLFTQISFSVCLLFFPVIIYIYWLSLFTYLPPNFHLQVYSLPWPQLRVFALLVHTKKCFPKKKICFPETLAFEKGDLPFNSGCLALDELPSLSLSFCVHQTAVIKNPTGNSLALWWLRLCIFTAVGPGSIPSWGTKTPHTSQCGQKIRN